MSKLPIVDGIIDYIKEDNVPFSMPGHKNGRGFLTTEEGKKLYQSLIKGDITEVEGVDNLHNAESIIKESQELLRDLYGSYKSYFLVNGSTSGNLAMIFSCFNEGDKIIVERNCHRSVFNAIILKKLRPIYIKNIISKAYNAPFSIDMEHFLKIIDEHPEAKGIVVTYPNYYGICTDLKAVIKRAKEKNMLVLVDSAHGAHFGFSSELPESAVKLGADIVVMSAHKTLPSLTQSAYLHVGDNIDINKVNFYVSAFTSTSPSYMLMSTLDYARYFMETQGRQVFEECIKIANIYREKINSLQSFHILSREDIKKEFSGYNYDMDATRFVIHLDNNYSGHELLEYLRGRAVQCEMSDDSNVVLILSPFNIEQDYEKLYYALKQCPLEQLKTDFSRVLINDLPQTAMLPYEVMDKDSFQVEIDEAVGSISAASIVPYPPGVPIIMPGEIVDEEAINMIKYYLENNKSVLGVNSGKKILVIKE
jgi:arginine/lysine/ornithine decarboxylase